MEVVAILSGTVAIVLITTGRAFGRAGRMHSGSTTASTDASLTALNELKRDFVDFRRDFDKLQKKLDGVDARTAATADRLERMLDVLAAHARIDKVEEHFHALERMADASAQRILAASREEPSPATGSAMINNSARPSAPAEPAGPHMK